MRNKSTTRRCLSIAGVCLAALGAALWINPAWAQQVATGIGRGFRAQLETYPPPNETQIKTSLEGEKAEPQSGGKVLLTEAWLKSFSTNGAVEMKAHAPKCVFDTMQRTVSSTGVLQIQLTSEKFFIEGTGFLMQTNGHLILSNQVHTVIRNFPGHSSNP